MIGTLKLLWPLFVAAVLLGSLAWTISSLNPVPFTIGYPAAFILMLVGRAWT